MVIPKIEERTLYPPLINHLESIGFKAVGETKVIKKSPDILFQVDTLSFVIEVKIGKPEIGLKAVAQASDYARKLNTTNIIILIYPEKYRNEPITDSSIVEKIALDVKINTLVLTEYWTESLIIKPIEFFEKLKQQIISKQVKVDFKTNVNLIGSYVKDLNAIIYEKVEDELISEVVNKLDLFSSIGDIKDKDTAKKQVINLASYLLFNQLLFYHIYNKKDKTNSLMELEEIENIKDIQNYFNKITNIDYQSIYRVNILGHIPKRKIVINTLNEVIKAIKLLRAEHITQDLAGRFFHDLIPFEVRKVLAAFYTHPIAAEILASLTIDSWDDTIIDPACGSGTLLVSSYLRKQNLYQKLYGYKDSNKIHKQFIEKDLTGIDIMPFAAHISAINLTMQNIEQETNKVRIATLDSLEMVESLKSLGFKRKGIGISPYSTAIQLTLDEIYGKSIIIEKKGAVSPTGKGSEFFLKPVDVVIMNPPFSDREKMPLEMREKLKKNPLGEICGHRVNLWGYFLTLADLLLKKNGKIGAVIPINIARGKATEDIRNYLLERYQLNYIIKPIGDIAFSEGATFRDVLLIAEKRKPKVNDLTGIIFLKKSIREMNDEDVSKLLKNLNSIEPKKNSYFVNEFFEIFFINTSYLKENKENLMVILRGGSIEVRKIFINFFDKIKKTANVKLRTLTYEEMAEGFHASPKGLSQLVFITNPIKKSRTSRNVIMTIDKEDSNYISINVSSIGKKIKLSKNIVAPALKTMTSISKLDITDTHDYIILNDFKGFENIRVLSKWKGEFDWNLVKNKLKNKHTRFALQHRIRMNSPNTHLIGVYNSNPFYTTHAFNIFKVDDEESKIMALFFNSVIGISQLSTFSKETTAGYMEFMQSDLIKVKVLNLKKLSEQEKLTLLNFFNNIKDLEFPSILEQLENRFSARIELDKTILKILGFTKKEINKWLPKIYDALIDELKAMKNLK